MTPSPTPSPRQRIAVIGAGIVGCAAAYRLALDGHEVVLVDAADGPATGTSLANGAQLSYSYVEPLASPATLRGLPGMLLDGNSPLRFRLRLDARQWRWGLAFLAACTARRSREGTRALLALAQSSRAVLDEWMAREAWDFAFERNGKLVLCPDAATLARQRAQVDFQAGLGCQQEVLDREGCLAREPALRHGASAFVGGVWTADECVGDPHLLARGLVQSLRALGGECRFGTRITGWDTSATRVLSARTQGQTSHSSEPVRADAFVLAAGPAAAALARGLGLYLPVYPIKGYSLTLPGLPGVSLPIASVTDLSRKTVFAPLAGRLRVAAMAEIGDAGLSIPADRVQRMLDSVQAVFPGLVDLQGDPAPWAGLRPATPTSVPIVGPAPRWDNLWLDVGHGALGLTLAAGSAHALAEQIGRRAHP